MFESTCVHSLQMYINFTGATQIFYSESTQSHLLVLIVSFHSYIEQACLYAFKRKLHGTLDAETSFDLGALEVGASTSS